MLVKSAYSRTVIRPSMREMEEYSMENFTGGPSFTGNNELERSLIDNVDLRWEWFSEAGELLAIGGYYKVIRDAIELQYLQDGTSDGSRQPINSSDAKIAGIEMEYIKKLDFVPALKNISLNSTLTWSKVELDENSLKQEAYFPDASEYRPFQGQSSMVGNLFVNYKNSDIGFTRSIYYNMFGTRLAELTATDVPWMW